MRHVLMHISDLHAGPPFRLKLAEQVAREAHELKPDLLVVSGDFVQRADFVNQWQTIAAYLKTLPEPRLVRAEDGAGFIQHSQAGRYGLQRGLGKTL